MYGLGSGRSAISAFSVFIPYLSLLGKWEFTWKEGGMGIYVILFLDICHCQ